MFFKNRHIFGAEKLLQVIKDFLKDKSQKKTARKYET